MPHTPKLVEIETNRGWMVSVPPTMSGSGKRVRKFFPEQKQAAKFAASLRTQYREGQRSGVISHELAHDASSANKLLSPHGASILDAAKFWVDKNAKKTSATLAQKHKQAMAENELHWSNRYLLDMERLPRWVGDEFMDLDVMDITRALAEQAMRANGSFAQSTLESRWRYISAVLGHKTKHRKRQEIEIMTVTQCAAMLRACESAEERRACALLLFAGIRPSAEDGEITRLDWRAVGRDEIYVSREASKTGDRFIPISPRLARLLRGHPSDGTVVPANWRRVYKRLRDAVEGLSGKQDITRHTFASNYLAAYGEDATKAAMGHSKGSMTLFRHYRAAIQKAAGVKFFR
jgi:hypothetical protein